MHTKKSLIVQSPGKANIHEETLEELKPDQVLVRSVLSAFKHGTEMMTYDGSSPFLKKKLDSELRVFVDNSDEVQRHFYPRPLGNMTVGIVEAVGKEVQSVTVGEKVFGWLPVANYHVISANKIQSLGELTPEQALCIDPGNFALGGVLDGEIRYGEKVLITGLGAIGLLAVQYCKLSGATVYAASSFALRRQLALEYGADVVLDSNQVEDLGVEIKRLSKGGVDLVLECSGRYPKLHQAVRATRQCGRVVCVGFYSGGATALNLGEEFFHNRITLLASLPAFSWNNPVRGPRPLYASELQQLVIQDFQAKRITVEGLLRPIYEFKDAEKAVETIATQPETVIKVAIKY
ncbi:zinc-binding dehydrogenase [Crocosphaera sp. XPORK-15E]|uniref:zinc-binding dehydrogenase n=1 Tax=Crocosphaera sp. XPORK-15E TaxID=3110247 RepID=UPI002B20CE3C|nr:zinc-binding dehydrogenase [Crocosphaera sp. XPORK-15E]MEA5533139.1 zinc-binding dehydrogenase [Crocosphaera sp. XPORK-15E]